MKTTKNKSIILIILFTSSNIIYTITNLTGNVIFWTSVGSKKIKGMKKVTLTTILVTTKITLAKIISLGYKFIHIKLKGFKKNKKSVLKQLKLNNLNILSISDSTSLAHNGCKQKKIRRI